MAICAICKRELSQDCFHKNPQNKSGYDHRCKDCRAVISNKRYYKDIERSRTIGRKNTAKHRETKHIYRVKSYVKKRYGITVEELNNFVNKHLSKYGMSCEACGKEVITVGRVKKPKEKRIVVDHCHKTGKLRGMICDECNKALGMVNDDINILNSLIKYLKKYNKNI
jgi:hypothetical protein